MKTWMAILVACARAVLAAVVHVTLNAMVMTMAATVAPPPAFQDVSKMALGAVILTVVPSPAFHGASKRALGAVTQTVAPPPVSQAVTKTALNVAIVPTGALILEVVLIVTVMGTVIQVMKTAAVWVSSAFFFFHVCWR